LVYNPKNISQKAWKCGNHLLYLLCIKTPNDMMNYTSLTKAQLIELVNALETQLTPAIVDANKASKEYSTELSSQLPFEVGYLNGIIKNAVQMINDYKACSK
jgi:hypothetical protein